MNIGEITVTVSGPTGSGKSGVLKLVECALLSVGFQVQYDTWSVSDAEHMSKFLENQPEQFEIRIAHVKKNYPVIKLCENSQRRPR